MDNFTKGLLERNEMRNKALGIATTTKHPAAESTSGTTNKENRKHDPNVRITDATKKVSSPRKSSTSNVELVKTNAARTPTKTRTVTSKSKDDADVAVEINITSTQNVQVEVEVSECEYDENGKMFLKGETVNSLSNYDSSSNSSVQLRDHSRRNLKRLGVLYSETDQISSPIQRTEENFCENTEKGSSTRPMKKFSKLAALAKDINNWDDDYSHHELKALQTDLPSKTGAIPKKIVALSQSPAKRQSIKETPDKIRGIQQQQQPAVSSPSKKLLWDKKVIDSLEAQGFTRRESNVPKLVYNYAEKSSTSGTSPVKSKVVDNQPKTISSPSSKKVSQTVSSPSKTVSQAISSPKKFLKPASPAKKEQQNATSGPSRVAALKNTEQKNVRFSGSFRNQKDPADLSLKERMAIFEKNKGTAPVPKTPFGIADANPIRSNMPELSKKFNFGYNNQEKQIPSPPKQPIKESIPESAAKNIKTTVNKLLTGKETTISEKQISDDIRKQREEDMKCILNRFNKQPEIEDSDDIEMPHQKSEGKRLSTDQKFHQDDEQQINPEVYQKADDKKRARVSNQQRLYPVLSDIESTTETDSEIDNYTTATVSGSEDVPSPHEKYNTSNRTITRNLSDTDEDYTDEEDDANMSFGRDILSSVKKNDLSRDNYMDSTLSSADVSDVINDMDDYLNEALDGNESKASYDDKGSACSDSFEYARYPKRVSFAKTGRKSQDRDMPVKSRLEISPSKNPNGPITLVHTVSFYRRQQSASASNTPVKKIIHKSTDDEDDDFNSKNPNYNSKAQEECQNKIKRLLDEVMKQQTVISQTSQALNLCASTVEFSGSTEAVEGERHLLVATHRRMACLNEVQRLKVEGILDRSDLPKERGTLTIQEIIIPMKQTYINRLANDEINGHHLLCLVKYNEFVLATKTLPTLPGLKSVKFQEPLTLNEVYADFKITLEIYGMTAQREILPHDIKYHIQTPNKKKQKKFENMVRPPMQSPGGPNAVRTPALVQYGYIIFSIREIKQKSWVINETAAGVSPLNGNVYLKIDSKITVDVDHCGFLTMFDDISGFGAWHRRWCRLSGNTLYYWKYPEDEKRKETLGQLDLSNICSEKVDVAPRAICARLHTILLESKRERRPDDVDTLVLVPKEKYTTVRHLLAADTKEEREEWCQHLNKSLSLMKSWGNQH